MELEVKGRVSMYVCGGIATDIAKVFEADRNKDQVGFASLDSVYIDTSTSDLDDSIPAEAVYLLAETSKGEELDGSGKIPSENAEEIGLVIKDLLSKHAPSDSVIIMSSLSGGTGSVFARYLAKELLTRGVSTVVAVGIATWGDKVEIRNSLNCLKSYDHFSRESGNPLAMYYAEYGRGTPTAQVQEQVQELISGLQVLFSRQNKGLDRKDIRNWQNYTVGTDNDAKLVSLNMVDKDETFATLGQVISTVTLMASGTDYSLPITPDIRYRGFSNVAAIAKAPVHFVTSEGLLIEKTREMEARITELTQQQESRKSVKGISDGSKPNNNGLFL
jgi:hypothetical protein